MQLYYSETSPFARAVRVVALERRIDLELEAVNPFGPDVQPLLAANPLGRIPTLRDGARLIHDSRVITRYLDQLGDRPALAAGITDEVRISTGHGVMEAALQLRLEMLRDPSEQSPAFMQRQRDRILRTTAALEPGGAELTLGDVYVVCAMEYVDFRHGGLDWRSGNPALDAYASEVCGRAPMQKTAFPR